MSEADTTNPEAFEPEEVVEGQTAQGDDQTELDADSSEEEQTEEELEEIEREGKKYRIPKALAPELMMQADYTRKTQEVAATRAELEARATAVAQQAETVAALREDYGKLHGLKAQVEAYSKVDWTALGAEDPSNAQAHWMQYQQLRDAYQIAEQDVSKKEQARLQEQQQSAAKALEETERVLSRDIPGWGPELVKELVGTAAQAGVSVQELQSLTDPRLWKLLHKAHLHDLNEAKQKKAQTIQKQAAVTPAVTPKGSFSGAGVHDKLPTEEWMRRRNAELSKKRA